MNSSLVYGCLLLTALFCSIVRGTQSERILGLILLAGNIATITALQGGRTASFVHVSTLYLVVDAAAAIALCWAAVARPSWMTILVAAFQINGTLAHLVKVLAPETFALSYAVLLRMWSWPMVGTLLLAHWRPNLRALIRQSDLAALPAPLRPARIGGSVPPRRPNKRKSDDGSEKAMEHPSTSQAGRQSGRRLEARAAGRRSV